MNKKYIEEHDTQLKRLNDRKTVNEDLVEGSSRQEERETEKSRSEAPGSFWRLFSSGLSFKRRIDPSSSMENADSWGRQLSSKASTCSSEHLAI